MGYAFSNQDVVLTCHSFILVLQVLLISKVIQVGIFLPTIFSEVMTYICNAVKFYYHSLHFILGSSVLIIDILIFVYMRFYSLCCKVLWTWWMDNVMCLPLDTWQCHHSKKKNKISYESPSPSPPYKILDNLWSVYHLYNFFLFFYFF